MISSVPSNSKRERCRSSRVLDRPDSSIEWCAHRRRTCRLRGSTCPTTRSGGSCVPRENLQKTLVAREQDRSKVARFWMRWKINQHRLDPGRVFIDETWVKINMTRTRGWCQRGEPLTYLAGLRRDSIDAPFVLGGPMNGVAFTEWVRQCPVPTQKVGEIVILDNIGSHKGKLARDTRCRSTSLLLAAVQPRPQSCRDDVCQTQDTRQKSRGKTRRNNIETHRRAPQGVQSPEYSNYLRHAGHHAK